MCFGATLEVTQMLSGQEHTKNPLHPCLGTEEFDGKELWSTTGFE